MIYSLAQQSIINYFGEDLVDTLPDRSVIKFPEFHIENLRSKSKHLIKDLYVAVYIKENKIQKISGFRGTVSDKEYAGLYVHSHLHSRDNPAEQDNRFCLGDSDVSTLQGTSYTGAFTEHDWMLFCLSLDNYVKCESQNPYMFFKDIRNQRSSNSRNATDTEIIQILKLFAKESLGYDVLLDLTGNVRMPVEAIIDDDFLRALVPYIPEKWLGVYDENKGYGIKLSTESQVSFFGETSHTYIWKGETKKVMVYSTFGKVEEKIDYDFPTQSFKDNLTRLINFTLNNKYETEYSNRTNAYTSADLSKTLFSNLLRSQ